MGSSTLDFFFQAEDGIRDLIMTGVQTCALPIYRGSGDDRCGMRIHLRDPLQLSGSAVYRDHVRAAVHSGGAEDVADDHVIAMDCGTDARDGSDRKSVV